MANASITRMIVSRAPAATAVSHSKNDACTSLGTPGGRLNLKVAIPVATSFEGLRGFIEACPFDDNPSRDDLGADDNGADFEERLTGLDAQKAKSAAIAAVGGGTLTEVERDDGDDGYGTSGGVYEVEVKREDGSQLEVHLDGDYNVVGQEADEDGTNDD